MNTYERSKKRKILVVDDSELNRSILTDMLKDDYEILEARDGVEAVAAVKQHDSEIALMLLDIVMPKMDGFEVLKVMNKGGWIDHVPVIMISAEASSKYISQAYDMGVTDYIVRPFDFKVVHHKANNTIMLHAKQKMLQSMVTEQIYQREKQSGQMVEILSNIVEFRNMESKQHIKRIREYSLCLGKSVMKLYPEYELTAEKLIQIGWASSLHDIGKIAIPDSIILKPGKLTPDEFELIKSHTTKGAEIIQHRVRLNDRAIFEYAYDIARHHHEKYDGKGYPDGLKGDEISIAAQIVSLVDVYDALTSKRVYKAAYEPDKAYQMILNGHSGTFSPKLLKAFAEVRPRFESLLSMYADED